MEYIRFGSTGLKVSRICLGCMSYGRPTERWPWALDEEQSQPFIQRALELGINFFDIADVYSNGASEEVVGKALRKFASRDEVIITTKVYLYLLTKNGNRQRRCTKKGLNRIKSVNSR